VFGCCIGLALLQALGTAAAEKAAAPVWTAKAKGCTQRFAHSAVWDAKREAMLVFAGEGRDADAFIFFSDLWTYNPAKDEWKELTLKEQARPSKRAYHACAWDTRRNQMWVFGGSGADFKGMDDLWSFDPAARKWTKLEPKDPRPKGRLSATLQYHPDADALLLVGGLGGFGEGAPAVRDLWVYDIQANKWSQKKCAAPQLWQCASVLDPKAGLLILHGGFDERFQVRTETWVYEVGKDKWREPVKGERFADAHTGVWDAAEGRMLVYGGSRLGKPAKGTTGYDEVWAFDPGKGAWNQVEVRGAKPGGRAYHSAVWEPRSRSMLVFGGTANQFSDPPRENKVWVLRLPQKGGK
jgi:N-acetylneuraminic acid mutarotase